jgi:hypothetical protein
MSSSIEEVIFLRPVFITATNMVVPIGTVTIKNILETKIITILNIFYYNISHLILVIMGSIVIYNLYKFIRNENKV